MNKSERCKLIESAIREWEVHNVSGGLLHAIAHVLLDMNKPTAARARKALPKVEPFKQMAKFSEWYDMYPRHEYKEAGIQAWSKIEEKDYSYIIGTLQAQLKAGHFDKSTKMIPMPASWLNGKRWMDEIESTKKTKRVAICDTCPSEATIEYCNIRYCRPCYVTARGY